MSGVSLAGLFTDEGSIQLFWMCWTIHPAVTDESHAEGQTAAPVCLLLVARLFEVVVFQRDPQFITDRLNHRLLKTKLLDGALSSGFEGSSKVLRLGRKTHLNVV